MSAVINGTYNQGLATSNAPANWRYMNATYMDDDFEGGYLSGAFCNRRTVD
ncbi:MAG: hypothetical protein ACLT4D_03530 [Blautia faecis]